MFSKYDVYTTVQSMYRYPDMDVLINKLDIRDKAELIAIFNNTAESTLTFEKKWYNRNKEGECYAAQRSSKVDSGRIR